MKHLFTTLTLQHRRCQNILLHKSTKGKHPQIEFQNNQNNVSIIKMEKTPKNTPALRIHSKHTSQQTSNIPQTILFLYSAKVSQTHFFLQNISKRSVTLCN